MFSRTSCGCMNTKHTVQSFKVALFLVEMCLLCKIYVVKHLLLCTSRVSIILLHSNMLLLQTKCHWCEPDIFQIMNVHGINHRTQFALQRSWICQVSHLWRWKLSILVSSRTHASYDIADHSCSLNKSTTRKLCQATTKPL